MSGRNFLIANAATAALTASPTYVATGTAIKTMLQVKSAKPNFTVVEWGYSLDATPTVPVKVELLTTGTVAATGLTSYNVGDIVKWDDGGETAAELTLGTGASGFATTAPTEGSITATRLLDVGIPMAAGYVQQWPLDREPGVLDSDYLRIRVTTATTVNMLCYVIIELK
jgi:hypothetical protein